LKIIATSIWAICIYKWLLTQLVYIVNRKRKILLVVVSCILSRTWIYSNAPRRRRYAIHCSLVNIHLIFHISSFSQISIINHSNRLFRFIIQSINSSLHHYYHHHQYQSKLSIILYIYSSAIEKKENSALFFSTNFIRIFFDLCISPFFSHLFQRQQSWLFNKYFLLNSW
jgi:hypothetical protein